MKIVFIRHGKTKGNMQAKYIGTTDEEICSEGAEEIMLHIGKYPKADIVFVSPMKRCIQTAMLIYPELFKALNNDNKNSENANIPVFESDMISNYKISIINEFREIDFGEFEGKNYSELSGNPAYQEWIDSGGKNTFPNGESRECFSKRCVGGFEKSIEKCRKLAKEGRLKEDAVVVFVVHGGTIMSVLEKYDTSGGDYFDYQCANGDGYICRFTDKSYSKLKIESKLIESKLKD